MSNKKDQRAQSTNGFTLLEVVVALGILTVVMVGVISLVVSGLSLSEQSRNSTEATALIQKGLADAEAAIRNNLNNSVRLGSPYTLASPPFNPASTNDYSYHDTTTNKDVNVEIDGDDSSWGPLPAVTGDSTTSLNDLGFYKVTVTIDWSDRSGSQSVEASQYIARSQQ